MSGSACNHVVRLVGMCALLAGCFAGCGSGPSGSGSDGIFPSLQEKDSGPYAGATCTISLYDIQGDDEESLAYAKELLAKVKSQTSWKDLHVVSSEGVSKVCRGYFKSFSSNEAQGTLREVRSYTDPTGQKPFAQAIFSDLPGREAAEIAAGPEQWDLRRAPGNASLCIEVYTDSKDRVNTAIKQVQKLRGKGTEAWYYHGQYRSGVYVGHFNASYEEITTGKTTSGKTIVRNKFVTHDPGFAALRKEFPAYKIDDKVSTLRVGSKEVYECSRLVPIPRFDEDVMDSEIGL